MENKVLAFSVTKFCELIDISRRHFYTLLARNEAPPTVRLGGRIVIPAREAEAWLTRRANLGQDTK